ncbi:MAG: SDR family oxidoreductase, partial [Chloroflexi bacterium]|nr:SDR family oxidoreductase [Chloroflexota bacterium]
PGLVATEASIGVLMKQKGVQSQAELEQRSPLGRLCQPQDIANLIAFLCSSRAATSPTPSSLSTAPAAPTSPLVVSEAPPALPVVR